MIPDNHFVRVKNCACHVRVCQSVAKNPIDYPSITIRTAIPLNKTLIVFVYVAYVRPSKLGDNQMVIDDVCLTIRLLERINLMLTFVCGWRSPEREQAMIDLRDPDRATLFFIDNVSSVPDAFPDASLTDLYRNGLVDFTLAPADSESTQIMRVNFDTDNSLIVRAVSRALTQHTEAQIIVTFDAADALYRLNGALGDADAMLAAESRLDAAEGDRVVFTRGGSFMWTDHLVESQTAMLLGAETLDMGILNDDMIVGGTPAASYRFSS